MKRVRFAPSPTGSLHVGNALSAVINRRLGDHLLLRASTTRTPPGTCRVGNEAILADLDWLGLAWDEGPLRQSERADRHREAARGLPARFDGVTLVREDGSPTYHLASRRRRRRLRDHSRRPRQRPPAERAAPPAALRGARCDTARVRPPRAGARRRRAEAVEARDGRDGRRPARRRHPGGSRPGLPRGARHCHATTCTTTCRGSAGSPPRRSAR